MSTWELIVIDRNRSFALHAWRYIARSIGFDVNGGKEFETDDGRGRVRWIEADTGCVEKLGSVLDEIGETKEVFALVEYEKSEGGKYLFDKVYDTLESFFGGEEKCRRRVFVVSARHVGERERFVLWPRSRRTLKDLRRHLVDDGSRGRERGDDTADRHILVTGAGFELQSPESNIGLPPTPRILREMKNAPVDMQQPGNPEDFPIPPLEKEARDLLADSARRGSLDEYWDLLLEEEMWQRVTKETRDSGNERRAEAKAEFQSFEANMRDAFRRSLLKYDWGHMKQSLLAAGLPWYTWLTTNYTHFADRAIALRSSFRGNSSAEVDDGRRWRIISTAAAANTASQEAMRQKGESLRYRLLFKLHGDLSDLHTMAIAGHDKDPFSPLSVKVESLGLVYEAAERFLSRSLRSRRVIWHIVGHGLKDQRLLDLMANVFMSTRGSHTFFIVAPETPGIRPEKERRKVWRELLDRIKLPQKRKTGDQRTPEVRRELMTAQEYMAQIEQRGLSRMVEKLRTQPSSFQGLRAQEGREEALRPSASS